MSTVIPFRVAFLRSGGIIPTCITLERQNRLVPTVTMNRPWAAALARLLRERDVKKRDLSVYGLKRAGTISDVLHQPKQPDIRTLQQLADVFTAYDRRADGGQADAPAVPLWEFFVSDEQSALLRAQAAHQASLIKPPEPTEEEKEFRRYLRFKEWEASQREQSGEQTAPEKKKKRA